MNDKDAAYRVGYVAGFGLGILRKDKGPHANIHTSWTNYVPNWVGEAHANPEWVQGWDEGLCDGLMSSLETSPFQ